MVLYALCQGLSEPAFVLKIPYHPGSSGRLKRAFDHLTELAVRLEGSSLSGSVPRAIFFGEVQGYPVLVESFLPGRSLVSLAGNRARLKRCSSVFAWLAQFGLCTLQRVPSEEIRRRNLITPGFPVSELNLPESLREYAARTQDAMLREDDVLPLVFVHNDLIPRNVLLSENHIGLLDWEFSQRQGLPLLDGIDFAISMIRMFRNESFWPGFRHFVTSGDMLERQMRYEVRKLAATLQVKRHWIEGLLVSYLLGVLSTTSEYGDDVFQSMAMLSAGGVTRELDELAPMPETGT